MPENASVMEAGAEAQILSNCEVTPAGLGGWVFLLIMTSIILLLEGNYVYRVSCTYQVFCGRQSELSLVDIELDPTDDL